MTTIKIDRTANDMRFLKKVNELQCDILSMRNVLRREDIDNDLCTVLVNAHENMYNKLNALSTYSEDEKLKYIESDIVELDQDICKELDRLEKDGKLLHYEDMLSSDNG